jgi:hypothetical protein
MPKKHYRAPALRLDPAIGRPDNDGSRSRRRDRVAPWSQQTADRPSRRAGRRYEREIVREAASTRMRAIDYLLA